MHGNNNKSNFGNLILQLSKNASLDDSSAKDYLEGNGFNSTDVTKNGVLRIRKLQTQLRLKKAKEKQTLLSVARQKFDLLISKKEASSNDIVNLFLGQKKEEMIAFGRNLNKLDEADAASFMTKAKLLEIIEELDSLNEKS